MTRINRTGTTGAQSIPSQEAGGAQQVSKPETQKTQQEPSAAEQQQGKLAAQGRKNEMDLHGNLKQSELAQYGHLGGSGRLGDGGGQGKLADDGTVADAVSGAGEIVAKEQYTREDFEKDLGRIVSQPKSEEYLQKELQRLQEELNPVLEHAGRLEEINQHAKEKAAQTILDTYLPKKESNSSKKAE
jgi:hypothetical protein